MNAASDAPGRLHVCAVPIGNLGDASDRLRAVLGGVGAIACEDTRTTGRLLSLLGVAPAPRLLAHHEHNERAGAAGIVALLLAGEDVALVSDAGTPAVNDPGTLLVDAAHGAGVEVVTVPGPSAVAAAVSIAGFGGAGYRFVGFLPRSVSAVAELAHMRRGDVVVAFESPSRVRASVGAVAEAQPARRVAVCRELTKRHEQVLRGRADEVSTALAEAEPRGEYVLVLDVLEDPVGSAQLDERAVALVARLEAEGMRRKRACAVAADTFGASSRELYAAALAGDASDD